MKFSTDGLILRETLIKERDKSVTILTRSNGLINAFVNGGKSVKSKKNVATGMLTYSDFSIYSNNGRYYVDEAEASESFLRLRNDVSKLTLAQYFCELMMTLAPEEDEAQEQLRLILNSLYVMNKFDRPDSVVKAAFEMRLLQLSGYMPDLLYCAQCGQYEHERMNFLPQKGLLICGDCIGISKSMHIETGIAVTHALRHCTFADYNKLFTFRLSKDDMDTLELCIEKYIEYQIGRRFKTLDFYKTIIS